jgi:hypothetical protein
MIGNGRKCHQDGEKVGGPKEWCSRHGVILRRIQVAKILLCRIVSRTTARGDEEDPVIVGQ